MASKAMELGRIKRASTVLQKKLYSSDPAVVKKAEARLDEIAKALRAWARKHRVKLHRHSETGAGAEARRRCKPRFDTHISGQMMTCFFVEKDGRNCLYECFPRTIDPF